MTSQVIHSKNRHYSKSNIPNALHLTFAPSEHMNFWWVGLLNCQLKSYCIILWTTADINWMFHTSASQTFLSEGVKGKETPVKVDFNSLGAHSHSSIVSYSRGLKTKNGHKEIIITFDYQANSARKVCQVCQLAKVYYIPYPKSQGLLKNRRGKGRRGNVTDNIIK